jgi:hypothetical protein
MEIGVTNQALFMVSITLRLSWYGFITLTETDHHSFIRLVTRSFSGNDFISVSQAIATAMKQGSNSGGMSAGCFSTLGNNPFDVVKASYPDSFLFS